MTAPSQHPGYFDAIYAQDPDPWGFETRAYERAKYKATLAALPRPHFSSALEVGCSIGVLTEMLAPRCNKLLGIDVAEAALERGRSRCKSNVGVEFAISELPERAPQGPFDLILLSEVLYYFDRSEIVSLVRSLAAQMTCGTVVVLVHWLGPTPDYPLSGDEAVEAFEAALTGVKVLLRERTLDYRLDVLERSRSDESVVQRD